MIKAKTREEFQQQLNLLFKCDDYSRQKNIVYIWKVERAIPRLMGESKILYIGRTKGSFASRYKQKKAMEIELDYFESVVERCAKEADLEESSYLEEIGETIWQTIVGISHCPFCGNKLESATRENNIRDADICHNDFSSW